MIFDAETEVQRSKLVHYFNGAIKAPYVSTEVSTLGGVSRASVLIRVSLDPQRSWTNNIFHNSRFFFIHVHRDGEVDQFGRQYSLPKMRKVRVASVEGAVVKINQYIQKVK